MKHPSDCDPCCALVKGNISRRYSYFLRVLFGFVKIILYICNKNSITVMIYDIEFENMYSFKEKVVFSMEGTATNVKSQNCFRLSDSDKCLKVGVIYGANASGKTNLIRGLFWFQSLLVTNSLSGENDGVSGYLPFGLTESTISAPSTIKIRLVHKDGHIYTYLLKVNSYEVIEESLSKLVEGEDIFLFKRIYISNAKHQLELCDGISDFVLPQNEIRRNQLGISFLQTVNVPVVTDIAYELLNIQLANCYNENMASQLWYNAKNLLAKNKDYRNKLILFLKHWDTGFKDFRIPNEKSEFKDLMFLHEMKMNDGSIQPVEFYSLIESLGTQNLFLLGVKIIEALDKGYTLFVDELDASLHTYITEFIIKMFQNERINTKHAQLILTTHDINLMDEKSLRLDQIWLMQKKEDGSSELYSLADFDGIDEDTTIKEWYMAKRFGGLPKIESIENLFRDEAERTPTTR